MLRGTVAEKSKNLAKKYSEEGNFGRAFSHYLVALKLQPEWKFQFRDEFVSVLCEWGTTLEKKNRFEDLFFCYEQALEILPDNVILLNNVGSHLLRCGSSKEAAHYFRKCLKINPHFLRASINLENICNLAVERWHFRMLNDKRRNDAFRKAIIRKVKMGFDQVLDVGTGTGLLSLFCVEGGAKGIYACDSSPAMIEVAESVLRANDANGVRLMPKHSTDLSVKEDIPGRVSLLVTETFDAGLLGEGIVQTLSHAWKNLLLPPRSSTSQQFGMVIPFSATLYLTGIECDAISDKFYLKPNEYIDNARSICDSYDTHDLKLVRCRYLTEIVKILKIDFNDPACIEKFTNDCEWKLTLTCQIPGRLDCFAVWFDLQLDENIVLSTNPKNDNNFAWDQGIFPLQRQKCISPQEQLQLVITYKDKLNIALDEKIEIREIPEEAVRILNDQWIRNTSGQLTNLLARTLVGPICVLDTLPFPLFGLNLIGLLKVSKNKLSCEISELDYESVSPVLDHLSKELKFDWTSSFSDEKFDVIFANFIDMRGELKDDTPSQLNYFKSLLKPNGILIPKKITVVGQFIHSEFLARASKVMDDDVTCGYKIAEFINPYQVQHYIDLEFTSLEKTIYSEPFDLFDVFDSVDAPAVIERVACPISSFSRANALIYWFRILLWEDFEFSTNQGLYHQAALLFSEINESEIRFKIIHSNGLFNIEFLRD